MSALLLGGKRFLHTDRSAFDVFIFTVTRLITNLLVSVVSYVKCYCRKSVLQLLV